MEQRRPFRQFVSKLRGLAGHYASSSGIPVHSHDEEFVGYRGVSTDVTDNVLAENAASAMVSLSNRLLESLPFGTMLFDDEDRLIAANDRAYHYLLNFAGEKIGPGSPFQSILLGALRSGFFPAVTESQEEWLRKWGSSAELPAMITEKIQFDSYLEVRQFHSSCGGILRLLSLSAESA